MKTLKALFALINMVAIILFLYYTEHLTIGFLGYAFLLYVVSSSVHLLAHESGHLWGGLISGYKLLCFQIGPLGIVSDSNKVMIRWKSSISGQCVMYPKQVNRLHYRFYNLGGIIANFIVACLGFGLLLFRSFDSSLLFIEVLLVGVKKILINIIPCKTNTGPNDGYIVMLLKGNLAVQKDYAMYLKIYSNLFLGRDVSLQEYRYNREIAKNTDELLYYNEIQKLLEERDLYATANRKTEK